MGLHILEIEINAEGEELAILSPINCNGEPSSGYRIAGPKAWGGSRNIAKLKVSDDTLISYILDYAPKVREAIKAI